MKWSWRIGRLLGIDVYMHATFLILLVWLGVSYYLPRQRVADVINDLTLIVALFGIIILHEMGHALTARRFGIRTRDITLLPIGGVARLERMPEDPKQELLVAWAGSGQRRFGWTLAARTDAHRGSADGSEFPPGGRKLPVPVDVD